MSDYWSDGMKTLHGLPRFVTLKGGDYFFVPGIEEVVYNADLRDQFEMVQSQWVASGNEAGGLSTDQDVIAGLTDPPGKGQQILDSTASRRGGLSMHPSTGAQSP